MAEERPRRLGLGNTMKVSRKAQEMAQHGSQGVDAMARQLSTELPPDEGDSREIEIEKIRPDADNGRGLEMTFEILTDPTPHTDLVVREEVEAIRELAASIKQDGMLNPIVVYEDGIIYRIVSGERRYWANRLLNKVLIQTKLLANRPRWLRRMQYSENANRRNLDLAHQLVVKLQVVEEAKANGSALGDVVDYQELLNVSQAMAYRWKAILEGPSDVRDAIQAGKLTSLVAAAEAAAEADVTKRMVLIETGQGPAEPAPLAASASPAAPASKGGSKKKGRGRPASSVKIGSVKSPGFAKWLVKQLDGTSDFKKVDWTDMKAASKAVKEVLKRLEKKFEEGGLK